MAHRCDGLTSFANEILAIGALRALQDDRLSGSLYRGWYECSWCGKWHLSRFERSVTRPRVAAK